MGVRGGGTRAERDEGERGDSWMQAGAVVCQYFIPALIRGPTWRLALFHTPPLLTRLGITTHSYFLQKLFELQRSTGPCARLGGEKDGIA